MSTPPILDDEAKRRSDVIERCLEEGFAPPGQARKGSKSAVREAARRLHLNHGTLFQAIDSGKLLVDWMKYVPPPPIPALDPVYRAQQGDSPEHDLTHPVPEGLTLRGTSIRYDGHGNIDQFWNKTRVQGRDPADVEHIPNPAHITKTATLFDAQGRVTQQWVTEKPEDVAREERLRAMVEEMGAPLPRFVPRPINGKTELAHDTLMNVVPFGDPHFGLYCWKDEVGNDFDLDIAKRDLCGAVAYLVANGPPAGRLLIANLGDFFHADNVEGKTARSGHILDMDTRLPKVIRVGVSAMRQCIETGLEHYRVVEVVNAIGNHDEVLSMALSIMLAQIYENEPRVIIHDAPTRRHYVRHGKVLIGITHGDRTKDANLAGIMAAEQSEEWGLTRHRYFLRGHHHHDAKDEFNGCIVEQFRTLAPGDAYAVGGGWLSGRDMKLISYHAEYGEVARQTCSIDLLRGVDDQQGEVA